MARSARFRPLAEKSSRYSGLGDAGCDARDLEVIITEGEAMTAGG